MSTAKAKVCNVNVKEEKHAAAVRQHQAKLREAEASASKSAARIARLAAAESELAKRQAEVHSEAAQLEGERIEINHRKQLQEVRPRGSIACTCLVSGNGTACDTTYSSAEEACQTRKC